MRMLAKLGRTVARGAALLVALSIGAYLVVSQQRGARGAEGSGAPRGGAAPASSVVEEAPAEFLSSSKSLVLGPLEGPASTSDASGDPRSDPEAVFLHSSKVLAPGSVRTGSDPVAEDEPEAIFLWGSKSGVIPSTRPLSKTADAASVTTSADGKTKP